MNFDQYFRERSDMVARVLLETTIERPSSRDWGVFSAGAACVAGAVAMQVWASHALIDPGFFARTSTFLTVVLFAGIWLLSIAQGAALLITRVVVISRASLTQNTLSQLLKVDGTIAHKLRDRQS
jgi:hypothetical protein